LRHPEKSLRNICLQFERGADYVDKNKILYKSFLLKTNNLSHAFTKRFLSTVPNKVVENIFEERRIMMGCYLLQNSPLSANKYASKQAIVMAEINLIKSLNSVFTCPDLHIQLNLNNIHVVLVSFMSSFHRK
jgi:hypothetical protein